MRVENGFMSWPPYPLVPGGPQVPTGSDPSSAGGSGLPADPGNPAPGGGCPPTGFCQAVPPSSHAPRLLGLAVFFTVEEPALALPRLHVLPPTTVLELTLVSLIERPG
jgi:hypothetical protein